MLSFTVRMRFEEADHEVIKQHLIALTLGSRQEPGCVSYIAHFISDTALEAHRNTPHFKEHAIGGLYQRMRERSMENLTAVA
jgi:quinol monooxygenase YgiN